MTGQEQVEALWDLQGRDHDLEEELAKANVTRVGAFQGGGLHASDVYEVILETGRLAYFKPLDGLMNPVGKRALKNYGHSPLSPVICECAAWQLAKGLGAPWDEMVATTALRFLTLPDGKRDVGSLTVYRPGRDKQRGYLDAVPEQAAAGAFFDALVGQQDRNDGNLLWYEERRQIYLIDHGFSFGVPGANSGEVILTVWRAREGSRALDAAEIRALSDTFEADFFDLRRFVSPERMDALERRARTMLDAREMVGVGVF